MFKIGDRVKFTEERLSRMLRITQTSRRGKIYTVKNDVPLEIMRLSGTWRETSFELVSNYRFELNSEEI